MKLVKFFSCLGAYFAITAFIFPAFVSAPIASASCWIGGRFQNSDSFKVEGAKDMQDESRIDVQENPKEQTSKQQKKKKRQDPDLEILKYRKIEPTAESLREFLQSLQPDHPSKKRQILVAQKLVAQLGSDNYHERQRARRQLGQMTDPPLSLLNDARRSRDPEVRASAALLLEYSKNRDVRDSQYGITRAVCNTIVKREIKGLFNELTETGKLFETDESTLRSIHAAMVASAVEKDEQALSDLISSDTASLRIVGIKGWIRIKKDASQQLLLELLADNDESIRLTAGQALANFGNRDSINALLDLMSSKDSQIRMKSNHTLRALTGQQFRFFAFDKSDKRSKAVELWKQWIDKNARTAELKFPLVELNVELERILISDYSSNKVIELDWNGKETWSHDINNPWAVQGLPNGNRLIGLYNSGAIVEFDPQGKEVRKIDRIGGHPMGFHYQENGNILVAGSDSGKIMEFDTSGTMIWEQQVGGRPTDIEVLENGNMMVALMDESRIVEFNREGQRVREIQTFSSPLHVHVTRRGTFVTAHSSAKFAVEYDRDGNELRRIEHDKNVTGATEMPNGDFLLTTSDSVVRVDSNGKTVWKVDGLTYCYNVSSF